MSAQSMKLLCLALLSRICYRGCNTARYFLDEVRTRTQSMNHWGDSRFHTSQESVAHSANEQVTRTKNVMMLASDTRPMALRTMIWFP